MQKTAILILAAGSSSRMGEPKQLLSYKKTTLLGHSIQQALLTDCKVFCVLGANYEIIKNKISNYPIKIIYNTNHKDGLSSSIVAGINYLENDDFDTVLIMLADQPKVDTLYLSQLLKTAKQHKGKIIASNYNDKAGVPAIFPKAYFNQLKKLQGDKGAKQFLNQNSLEIIKCKPFNLVDIDTQEDYQNLTK